MDKNTIQQLASAYLRGDASEEEKRQLHEWYDLAMNQEDEEVQVEGDLSQEQLKQRLLTRLMQKIAQEEAEKPAKVLPLYTRTWARIAASVLLVVLSATLYYLLRPNPGPGPVNPIIAGEQSPDDVLPGQNKALLTLANGETIVLDSAGGGRLAQQGSTAILHQNGQLTYTPGNVKERELLYNTLSTGRGEIYPLLLSDGSRVWLNAASSIHFPVAFIGNERRVEITGEVYFEVAKMPSKPFVVEVNGAEIQVLGTHFNVNAYAEETSLNTTLLEGAVRFAKDGKTRMLQPGQQLQLGANGQMKLAEKVDLDQVLAWKNGLFHFEGSDFETVARQLARWYDVEVVYNKNIDEHFYAEIPRNTRLSVVLKALELTGKVHFKIDGKKIIVQP